MYSNAVQTSGSVNSSAPTPTCGTLNVDTYSFRHSCDIGMHTPSHHNTYESPAYGTRMCSHAAERQVYPCSELQGEAMSSECHASGWGFSTSNCKSKSVSTLLSAAPIQLCFQCLCQVVSDSRINWTIRLAILKRIVALSSSSTATDKIFCAHQVLKACTSLHLYTSVKLSSSQLDSDGTVLSFFRESESYLLKQIATLVKLGDRNAIAVDCIEVLRQSDLTPQVGLVTGLIALVLHDDAFMTLLHSNVCFIPRLFHLLHRFRGESMAATIAKILLRGCGSTASMLIQRTGAMQTSHHVISKNAYSENNFINNASKRTSSIAAQNIYQRIGSDLTHLADQIRIIDDASIVANVLLPIFQSSLTASMVGYQQVKHHHAMAILQRYFVWAFHYAVVWNSYPISGASDSTCCGTTSKHFKLFQALFRPGGILFDHAKDIVGFCLSIDNSADSTSSFTSTCSSNHGSDEPSTRYSERIFLGLVLLHMLFASSEATTINGLHDNTSLDADPIGVHCPNVNTLSTATVPSESGNINGLTAMHSKENHFVNHRFMSQECNSQARSASQLCASQMQHDYSSFLPSIGSSQIYMSQQDEFSQYLKLPVNAPTALMRNHPPHELNSLRSKSFQSVYLRQTELIELIYEHLARVRNVVSSTAKSIMEACPDTGSRALINAKLDPEYYELFRYWSLSQSKSQESRPETLRDSEYSSYWVCYQILVTRLFRRLCGNSPDAIHIFHYSRFSNINFQILLNIALGNTQDGNNGDAANNCAAKYMRIGHLAHPGSVADVCAMLVSLTKITSKFDAEIIRCVHLAVTSISLSIKILDKACNKSVFDGPSDTFNDHEEFLVSEAKGVLQLLVHYCDLIVRVLRRRKAQLYRKSAQALVSKSTSNNRHGDTKRSKECSDVLAPELTFDHAREASIYQADQRVCMSISMALLNVVSHTISISHMLYTNTGSGYKHSMMGFVTDSITWMFTLLEFVDVGVISQHSNDELLSPEYYTQFATVLAFAVESNAFENIALLKPTIQWLGKAVSRWAICTDQSVKAFPAYIFADVKASASLHRSLLLCVHHCVLGSQSVNTATDRMTNNDVLSNAYTSLIIGWLTYQGLRDIDTSSIISALYFDPWNTATEPQPRSSNSVASRFVYAYVHTCLLERNILAPNAFLNETAPDLVATLAIDHWVNTVLLLFPLTVAQTAEITKCEELPMALVEALLQLIPKLLISELIVAARERDDKLDALGCKIHQKFGYLVDRLIHHVDISSIDLSAMEHSPLTLLASMIHLSSDYNPTRLLIAFADILEPLHFESQWTYSCKVTRHLMNLCLDFDDMHSITNAITNILGVALLRSYHHSKRLGISVMLCAVHWIDSLRCDKCMQPDFPQSQQCQHDAFRRSVCAIYQSAVKVTQQNLVSCSLAKAILALLVKSSFTLLCNATFEAASNESNRQGLINITKNAVSELGCLANICDSTLSNYHVVNPSFNDSQLRTVLTLTVMDVALSAIKLQVLGGGSFECDIQPLLRAVLTLRNTDEPLPTNLLSFAFFVCCSLSSGFDSRILSDVVDEFQNQDIIDDKAHHVCHMIDATGGSEYNNEHGTQPQTSYQIDHTTPAINTTYSVVSTEIIHRQSMLQLQIVPTLCRVFGDISEIENDIYSRIHEAPLSLAESVEVNFRQIDAYLAYIAIFLELDISQCNVRANMDAVAAAKSGLETNRIVRCFLKALDIIMASDISISYSETHDFAERSLFALQSVAALFCSMALKLFGRKLFPQLQIWIQLLTRYIISHSGWHNSTEGKALLEIISLLERGSKGQLPNLEFYNQIGSILCPQNESVDIKLIENRLRMDIYGKLLPQLWNCAQRNGAIAEN